MISVIEREIWLFYSKDKWLKMKKKDNQSFMKKIRCLERKIKALKINFQKKELIRLNVSFTILKILNFIARKINN